MEFNISDLLDSLQEVDLDIQSHATASESRIKELTMKKIHNQTKRSRRGLSGFSKILVAAAILASLAIPVMAATGFHFTEWLAGNDKRGGFDEDVKTGSVSANWEVSGWVVTLGAKSADANGLTMECEEWGNGEKKGKLTAVGNYWLEQWKGIEYTAMDGREFTGPKQEMKPNDKVSWDVTWQEPLEPGSYRLGADFVYTAEDGAIQEITYYVKFRIFNPDMGSYVELCRGMLDDLLAQDNWHLTFTLYAAENDSVEYHHYDSQVWKAENRYLEELQYLTEGNALAAGYHGRCYLFRDGVGYKLQMAGKGLESGITSWENANFVEPGSFDSWHHRFAIYDNEVGEVYTEENAICVLQGSDDFYWELKFELDENDCLTRVRSYSMPAKDSPDSEKHLDLELVIHDTAPAEIARVIDSIDLSKLPAFSWAEEQETYPAGAEGVKTSGFANTAARNISDAQSAIAVAQKEVPGDVWYNLQNVFFDEGAKMWKVSFSFTQDDYFCNVYMNEQGVTQLVVVR